ncbi:TVP38/TMEM64 family protein [Oligoflexus tunisiensis]|uniref:TVP38/TMEM64 family protein n=1 Tax=Oligoflexus tunisiensis TaxID=708132 RepID=UPI000A9C674B|nr:VTT domain-containing protein [Oligoflexus tunisiensis]
MKLSASRISVILLILLLVVAYFFLGLDSYLTLDALKAQLSQFQAFYQEHQLLTVLIYFGIYVVMAALSLPGAAVLTLAGGALFGFGLGLLLVSFASTLGATGAFLVARFLLRDTIQNRYRERLVKFNEGIQKEGAFYLFTLRLVPIFPFFVINLVMGLTPLRASTFYWVSQLGMLPGTMVYVLAGTQLARFQSLAGIVSLEIFVSFALLGIFPLLAKRFITFIKRYRKTHER